MDGVRRPYAISSSLRKYARRAGRRRESITDNNWHHNTITKCNLKCVLLSVTQLRARGTIPELLNMIVRRRVVFLLGPLISSSIEGLGVQCCCSHLLQPRPYQIFRRALAGFMVFCRRLNNDIRARLTFFPTGSLSRRNKRDLSYPCRANFVIATGRMLRFTLIKLLVV